MHARRRTSEATAATTLPVLLDRVGAELDRLALGVDHLQVQLSPVLVELMRDKHHLFTDLQRLDVLAQSLASLAAFVQGLGSICATRGPVDPTHLAGTLSLRGLAERLCGRTVADEAEGIELF